MRVVCNYSGGVCSFLASKRAVEKFGKEAVTLLFCDTGEEDEDLYRFLREGADYLGSELVTVRNEKGMDGLIDAYAAIPSNRMAFCTRELKREVGDAWMAAYAPDALSVFGIDWTEAHREVGLKKRLGEDRVWCPMTEPPYMFKPQMLDAVRALGIAAPRLYDEGFQHNNCGGACVKAGHASWAHLLATRPETYAKWEAREERVSEKRGFPCAVLRDRTGGTTRPLPLKEFRERAEAKAFDRFDWGGCGCFIDEDGVKAGRGEQ